MGHAFTLTGAAAPLRSQFTFLCWWLGWVGSGCFTNCSCSCTTAPASWVKLLKHLEYELDIFRSAAARTRSADKIRHPVYLRSARDARPTHVRS